MPGIDDVLYPQTRSLTALYAGLLGEAIKSLGSVPFGHLYARVAGHMTLGEYRQAIGYLKAAGDVTEKAHLLTWSGK